MQDIGEDIQSLFYYAMRDQLVAVTASSNLLVLGRSGSGSSSGASSTEWRTELRIKFASGSGDGSPPQVTMHDAARHASTMLV